MNYLSLLAGGAPSDEFNSESQEICDKITYAHTEQDIASVIAEVFNRTFNHKNETAYFINCARKIYTDLPNLLGKYVL